MRTACIGLVYIAISAALINYNKYLVHPDRFPFAQCLTLLHVTMTFVMSTALYFVVPSVFPTMEKTRGQQGNILKLFAPLSLAFTLSVVCANKAYLYSEVPFLQFMKQSNVAMIFIVSCIVGTQKFDAQKGLVIAAILTGVCASVQGEVHFVLLGFLIQGTSQVGEITKIMMQENILSSDLKLDPMTYQIFIGPGCIAALVGYTILTWEDAMLSAAMANAHLLFFNALLAFALNVTIAVFIKTASAMEFVLAGVVKDVTIVVASNMIQMHPMPLQQVIGFGISTSMIFYWSAMKIIPHHPIVKGPATWLRVQEREPLVQQKV